MPPVGNKTTFMKVPKAAPAPSRTLTTGNNPRGVAIIQPARAPAPVVTHALPASHNVIAAGPASRLAAIMPPAAAIQSVQHISGGVVGRLLGQVANLPKSTLIGVENLPNLAMHPKNLSKIVTTDPFVRAVEQGSLKPLADDPLGTLLDATIVGGSGGRVLGALARSGAAGDAVKAAAALGPRESFEAAPGAAGTAVERGYSPNVFRKLLQVHVDKRGGLPKPAIADAKKMDSILKRQVASQHTAEVGVRTTDEGHIFRGMKGAKPGKEEQDAASLMSAFGIGAHRLPQLEAEMRRNYGSLTDPDAINTATENIKNLTAIREKMAAGQFDHGAAEQATIVHAALRDIVEGQKHTLNMRSIAQMDRHNDIARALLEPDVHFLHPNEAVADPALRRVVQEARVAKNTADKNLKIASGERAAVLGSHIGASRTLSDLTKRIPVDPVTDRLLGHVLDMRKVLDKSLADTKPYHEARVAYYEKRAQTAADALRTAREAVSSKANRLSGPLIEDPDVPAIMSGKLKGIRARPVTADDMARIREGDPVPQSYVSLRNPEREGAASMQQTLRLPSVIVPAEKGVKRYTGEAVKVGDFRPGWSAMTNSLLSDTRAVHAVREWQNFLSRFSIANDEGFSSFDNLSVAKNFARNYTDRTGLKTKLVTDDAERIHVVPQAAADELSKQWKLDQASGGLRKFQRLNSVFRKTVLATSTKLPVMHQVENISRTALMERGNLPRALMDYRRGKSVLNSMDPAERARFEALTTPGSLSHAGFAGDAEDLGRWVQDEPGHTAAAVHATAAGLGELGTQIIRGQRALEKSAQITALGAHARKLLQENGKSWLSANRSVNQYVDELRKGLATPAGAERAAKDMHMWLGQYNAFTGNMRSVMRVMPFASWYINAAKLVMIQLPRDHPLFSALVHDTDMAVQNQWDQQHAGLPDDLQTAVSMGPGEWLDAGKFTPIGVEPLNLRGAGETAAGLTLPFITSPALALAGKTPFLGDIKGSPQGIRSGGKGSRIAAIDSILQLGESLVAPVNIGQRIAAHGVGGTLNPFRPTQWSTDQAPSGPESVGTNLGGDVSLGNSGSVSLGNSGKVSLK